MTEATDRFVPVLTGENRAGKWFGRDAFRTWDDGIPAFWCIAALMRPLALIAGPATGSRRGRYPSRGPMDRCP